MAGYDVLAQRREVRRAISLTGQYAALDELLTGEENLRMIGRLSGLPRSAARPRAAELLSEFDLAESVGKRVTTYSGGMRLHGIAYRQPTTPVIETLRGLLLDTGASTHVLLAAVWCAGITAASMLATSLLWRRHTR